MHLSNTTSIEISTTLLLNLTATLAGAGRKGGRIKRKRKQTKTPIETVSSRICLDSAVTTTGDDATMLTGFDSRSVLSTQQGQITTAHQPQGTSAMSTVLGTGAQEQVQGTSTNNTTSTSTSTILDTQQHAQGACTSACPSLPTTPLQPSHAQVQNPATCNPLFCQGQMVPTSILHPHQFSTVQTVQVLRQSPLLLIRLC